MTPEGKVKKRVIEVLKKYEVYYFFPSSNFGMGRAGVPDIICCYKGRFIAIECKAGNNMPTALQQKELKEIGKCGGIAMVVWEDNVSQLKELLEVLSETKD